MKKFIILIVLTVGIIFFVPTKNYAQKSFVEINNNYETLGVEEIKEKASNEITDLRTDSMGLHEYDEVTTTKQGDVVKYSVTEYKTAELLSETTLLNSASSSLYAVYAIQEFSNIFQSGEQWDDSTGFLATSVIYIERTTYTQPEGEYWRLLHSEGGWQRTDASLNTTTPSVTQATIGMGRNDLLLNQTTDYTPTNIASYSYSAPAGWEPINSHGVAIWEPAVGQTSQIEIYRIDPNNSWSLVHSNLYHD